MTRIQQHLLRLRSNAKAVAFALADSSIVLSARPTVAPDQTVLIVRLDAIGDFVLWLGAAQALIDRYRNEGRRVTLLANQAWADWARALNLAGEVLSLDVVRFRRDIRYRRQWLKRIRSAGYSTVVQPTYSRSFQDGDALVRVSGATQRIGSCGDFTNTPAFLKRWSDRWFTRLVPASPRQTMELLRNAEFLQGLDIEFAAQLPELPVVAGTGDSGAEPPYAVIFPAAGWAGRNWPAERFVEIGRRLRQRGLNLVVAGGKSDQSVAAPVVHELGDGVVDLVGKTNLLQLTELLRKARIVLANETSAIHIAAALNTAAVCILGGGHIGRFVPYPAELSDANPSRQLPYAVVHAMPCFGCDWNCIYSRLPQEAVRCIGQISVEQVWQAVESALAERDKPGLRTGV